MEFLLGEIFTDLREQVSLALSNRISDLAELEAKTDAVVTDFFTALPEIQQLLMKDVQANYDGDPAAGSKEEVIFSYPGLYAIFVYRMAHQLYVSGVPMILQVMDLETSPRDTHDPEIHRKYIDLQLFVSGGPEVSTFFVDQGKETVKDNQLDTPRDILFYKNRPETGDIEGRVVMLPGSYAVYFPWDVHIPGQCGGEGPKGYRKIVLKVPMEACLGA